MDGTGPPGGSAAGLQGCAEEAKPGEARTPWGAGSCRKGGPGAAARAFALPFARGVAAAAAEFGLCREKFVFVRVRGAGAACRRSLLALLKKYLMVKIAL